MGISVAHSRVCCTYLYTEVLYKSTVRRHNAPRNLPPLQYHYSTPIARSRLTSKPKVSTKTILASLPDLRTAWLIRLMSQENSCV